jgi:hypothetical protein|tara:strand:- start:39 stop:461 length:423 start_codon:yes stop_codon:yes gene_type:complete
MTVKGHLVMPEDVAYVWDKVHPFLDRVQEHTEGELNSEDFLEPLTHGDMQLWIFTKDNEVHSVMVTQIIDYPQKKILRVISLAGESFEEIKYFQENLEVFALKMECSALELWGRKGWKKLLPDWNDTYIVYTKDLKSRMQ